VRIFVTGGAGFIGSTLCRQLVGKSDIQVLNIDKLTYASNLASLASIERSANYKMVQADVCDQEAMSGALRSFEPDAIVHLAAESHVDRSITGSEDFIRTNVNGTFSLLEASRKYWEQLSSERQAEFRFLHVSTDEVFGSLGMDGLFEESTPYDPRSPYSASKAASDHLVRAWHHTYGLPTIVTNCSNNYGPFHFPEKLIPLVILNALHGLALPVYGNGENIRDWLYVDDHAAALQLVLLKGIPGSSYNVGGHNERTNLSVVEAICDILDERAPMKDNRSRRSLIQFVTDRPGHDLRYAIDSKKIMSELNWKPKESFETGIVKTVDWYLDNKDWWAPIRAKKYAGERLGLQGSRM
jgi:dTDP-glucose 4,6-dehydratase